MLRSLKDLESYKVSATDGEVGKTVDLLFDDQHFTTRYLIVDTSGFWEGEHKVLVSPISFRNVDWSTRLFHLNLSQAKLKDCPSVDLDKPVSRQYERQYSQYYGWPYYWGAGDTWAWGTGAYPYQLAILGILQTSLSMTRHGPSAIWSSIPATGGSERKSSSLRTGPRTSAGQRAWCIWT